MDNRDEILKDFDWQLNLALSSDKLASLNQPLVNIDLDLVSSCSTHSYKSIEMNPEELTALVTELEKANQALQQAKS